MRMMKLLVAFGLASAALMLPSAPARASIDYTLVDLGTLGGGARSSFGVNDSGQVTGNFLSPSGATHAFLSGPNGGALKDLGTLGGAVSLGWTVNDSGQVAGNADVTSGALHAFLSGPNGGALKDLGTLGGATSGATGVNESGQVTGEADLASGASHAFLSGANGGALKDLGTLGGATSFGELVNASGQVAGASQLLGGTLLHAFLSAPNGGALKDLGTLPGGSFSEGFGVNASGQVVGEADVPNSAFPFRNATHAFLSGANGGALMDLGTFGGMNSQAFSINDSGQVVGDAQLASGNSVAFLYSNGQMIDLNTLIAPGSGFTLTQGTRISNTGYITGDSIASDGSQHAFLLIPNAVVPEPSSLVLVALGLAGAAVARRRVARRAAV